MKFENPKHWAPRETLFMKGSVLTLAENFDPEAGFVLEIFQILIFQLFCTRAYWRILVTKNWSLVI